MSCAQDIFQRNAFSKVAHYQHTSSYKNGEQLRKPIEELWFQGKEPLKHYIIFNVLHISKNIYIRRKQIVKSNLEISKKINGLSKPVCVILYMV